MWRHPSEVALATRRHRRRRRQRALIVGTAGAAAATLLWLANAPHAELGVESDLSALADERPGTTVLAAVSWADQAAAIARADTATVRSNRGTETLARALVVDTDGHLITSGQALAGVDNVLVALSEDIRPATVVGYDALTDVSVLRVDGGLPSPATRLGPSIEAGDRLVLVNPLGPSDSRTVAELVTSAESREGNQLFGLVALDTDLGTNPPGTPAVDGSGAVVGISAATAEGERGAVVPIEVALGVAAEIIERGHAVHARLGVTARDLPDDDPVGAPAGAYITDIVSNGPADLGGLKQGDVIVAIDDVAVGTIAEMVATLRVHDPGETVEVLVAREGVEVGCVVELGSHVGVDA